MRAHARVCVRSIKPSYRKDDGLCNQDSHHIKCKHTPLKMRERGGGGGWGRERDRDRQRETDTHTQTERD